MDNAAYVKKMENFRNRIDVSNKKDYLKWLFKMTISKPSYMSQKIFDNNLMTIRKDRDTLTLNKPAYVRMCIFELSKVLMKLIVKFLISL